MTQVHTERMRVALSDTDASGRIHFAAAFRFAENAEHALLRAIGAPALSGFPRRHVEADYSASLLFNDEIEVEIWVEKVGNTSVSYPWRIMRDGVVCVEGKLVVVHVSDEGTPLPLGDELREGLGRYTR